MIRNAAPTLAGIKVANLYNFKFADLGECTRMIAGMNRKLNSKGIYIELMKGENNFYLLYVYRRTQLLNLLNRCEIKGFLYEFGYDVSSEFVITSYLRTLKERIASTEGFPHEIGVFLGYPIADVKEFIRQKGEGCALCGEWKVYYDVQSAMCFFCKLKKCKEVYVRVYKAGRSLYDMTVNA